MSYKNREDQRKYQREWRAARRSAWLAKNGPCSWCGSTIRLEIDHKDPSQKVSSTIWSWSAARREVELAKCHVLCHECHLSKTRGERISFAPHGTLARYGNKTLPCRCLLCKTAQRDRMREYDARRRQVGKSFLK